MSEALSLTRTAKILMASMQVATMTVITCIALASGRLTEFTCLYLTFSIVRFLMDQNKSWHADGVFICSAISIGVFWLLIRGMSRAGTSMALPIAFGTTVAVLSRYAFDLVAKLNAVTEERDMSISHLDTRRKLRTIAFSAAFDTALQGAALDPTDIKIMQMHYRDKHAFAFIGDTLGYSESGIKERHRKAIAQITPYLK